MLRTEFVLAAGLMGCYGLFLVALFTLVLTRSKRAKWKDRAAAGLEVPMRDSLVSYLAGSNDLAPLRKHVLTNRRLVAQTILSFRGTVGGGALDRLCSLALDLGLVHDWCGEVSSNDPAARRAAFAQIAFVCAYEPCRRVAGELLLRGIADADPQVAVLAARAMIQSAELAEIEQVFEWALGQNLWTRILLAEELRRQALPLCQRAVPHALDHGNPRQIRAVLDLLLAWERAIPLTGLAELMVHPDRGIRLQAFRLAPMAPAGPLTRGHVIAALQDSDPEISTAAALSAGRLKIEEALPSLARLVRNLPPDQARSAAGGLAELPPAGWQVLEELSEGTNPVAARVAREALETVRGKGAA